MAVVETKLNKIKFSTDVDNNIKNIKELIYYVDNTLNLDTTNEEWFAAIKEFAVANGYAGSPKDYKKDPNSYKGHVGDLCEAIRVMVTGRTKSPDLFSIMKVLGKNKIKERIEMFQNFQK